MLKNSTPAILLLLLVSFFACNKTKNPIFCSWKIDKIAGDNPFLKDADRLDIYEDHIVFSSATQSRTFHSLIRDNHMILQNQTTKWLFKIEKVDDYSLVLLEKYANAPVRISLIKNKKEE